MTRPAPSWIAPSLRRLSAVAALATLAGCMRPYGPPPPPPPHYGPPPGAIRAPSDGLDNDVEALRSEIGRLEQEVGRGGSVNDRGGPGLLSRLEGQQRSEDEQNRLLARRYYEVGAKLFQDGNYVQAKENLELAVQKDPGLQEARDLLNEIGMALGYKPEEMATVKKFYEERLRVMIQQRQIEVRNHLAEGKRLSDEGKYADALEEFLRADNKIKFTPYEIGLSEEREELAALIEETRILKGEMDEEQKRINQEATNRLAEAEEERRLRERREKVKGMFMEALHNFEDKHYEKAEQLARAILEIDPDFQYAKEMMVDAQRARHNHQYVKYLATKIEHWKEFQEGIDEAKIPYNDEEVIQYPNDEYWTDVVERRQQRGSLTGEGVRDEDTPEILAIKTKLETLKMDLDFGDASLREIVDFIRDFAAINIIFAPEVVKENLADERRSFQVTNLVLKNVLKLLLDQYGLAYTFQNKVLTITKPELAQGAPGLQLHDVRDIIRPLTDFPGPNVELMPPGADSGGGVGAGFGPSEEQAAPVTGEQIVQLIQQNIEPASWTERSNEVSIALTANGQLLVLHTPQVQKEIQDFLSNLRSFAGSMVTIESRFLEVQDNFLEDISFEFRGNDSVTLTDVNDGTDERVEAGIFRQKQINNNVWDARFRSAYPFTDFTTSRNLTNAGGVGIQWSLVSEYTWNTVLRALRKGEKATILTAPRVTVFNTQRANIAVAEQRAYIQDYDVEIAQDAAIYDPIIATVQDGLVLDVRPIISNDRKYITLELRPAVASLRGLREIDISVPVDPPGDPGYTPIQLPVVFLQRAQCTITMPDRGIILIGGMREAFDQDQSSETPFLSKIPVIGALFKRRTRNKENRSLMILIKAEIIDLGEREANRDRNTSAY